MEDRSGKQGFIKGLFFILILGALIYAGISFGKPYYRYYALKTSSRDYLKSEIERHPEAIKKKVMTSADELNVPLLEKNLIIAQSDNSITLKANWSETVDFFGYYRAVLPFVIDIKE